MSTRVLASVRGRTIRATRLDPCGVPDPGPCGTVVSTGFISVTVTGQQVTGRTYESRDIWGNLCISDSDPDELRSATVDVTLCAINPDMLQVLTGRTPVLFDGEAIGISEGIGRNWDAYSLEVWTKAVGDCGEWGYLLVPYVRNGRVSSPVDIQNGPLTISTTGRAYPANGWGAGPYDDHPFRADFADGDIYGMVLTDVAPPADTDLSLCPDRLIDGARFRIDADESAFIA